MKKKYVIPTFKCVTMKTDRQYMTSTSNFAIGEGGEEGGTGDTNTELGKDDLDFGW